MSVVTVDISADVDAELDISETVCEVDICFGDAQVRMSIDQFSKLWEKLHEYWMGTAVSPPTGEGDE
jgi:hypothetical protein